MRRRYHKQLDKLHNMLWEMGLAVEQAIVQTDTALREWDMDIAKKVADGDDVIDDMERNIENYCLHLITTQQSVAGDLRDITSTFRMITDLERIADQAADVCSCIIKTGENPPADCRRLSEISSDLLPMFRIMLKSYQNKDPELAKKALDYDDIIDKLFKLATKEFDRTVAATEGFIYCVFIAKYLERMGDHITNICEWILYRIKFSENW